MNQIRVLFVCIHNSGRSQMAEAFLKHIAGNNMHVESAGLEPRSINPLVIEVMQEVGLDLSQAKSNSIFDFFNEGRLYDYVISVCDDSNDSRCPVFPGITERYHWPFPDPAELDGTHAENMNALREIRDGIKEKIIEWYHATFK